VEVLSNTKAINDIQWQDGSKSDISQWSNYRTGMTRISGS
jgi:hypothetical protein